MDNLEFIKQSMSSENLLNNEIKKIDISLNDTRFEFNYILGEPHISLNDLEKFDLELIVQVPIENNKKYGFNDWQPTLIARRNFKLIVETPIITKLKKLTDDELKLVENKIDALLRIKDS